MSVLFHQNMRNFGGATPVRNAAYSVAFGALTAQLGGLGVPNDIGVAGFTEVCNNNNATTAFNAAAAAGGLCAALGINFYASVACGSTMLANGPEYVAIGVAANYTVLRVGRICLSTSGQDVHLIHDSQAVAGGAAPAAGWCNTVPNGATRDYRGLVYVVVRLGAGGPVIAVGFLHNLYTLLAQRILVMGQIPNMLATIRAAEAGTVAAYIGGDFNVTPQPAASPHRGTARIGLAYQYTAGLAAAPGIPGPAATRAFTAGGTLWSGNLYDYWHSSISNAAPIVAPVGLVAPAPQVFPGTLDAVAGTGGFQMSDHCGVFLDCV